MGNGLHAGDVIRQIVFDAIVVRDLPHTPEQTRRACGLTTMLPDEHITASSRAWNPFLQGH